MKDQAWRYANKGILFKILGASLAQQILIALSTWALIVAGLKYNKAHDFIFWCTFSFLFQLFAPAVQIFIKAQEYNLSFEAYRQFLHKNLLAKGGNPGLWRRKEIKDIFTSSMGIDAEGYLAAMLFVGLDIFTFLTSLILSMIVLGTMIDAKFVPAFVFSGILSYACYSKLNTTVKHRYEREQKTRTDFNSYILTCWDNIFFKNKKIIQKFESQLESRYNNAKTATRNAATASEFLVFALGLVSSLPILALVLWHAHNHSSSGQTSHLVALMATIPRQLNMLSTFRSIFLSMTAYIGFESKFRVIHQNVEIAPHNYRSDIRLEKITLKDENYETLTELTDFLRCAVSGRYEVRGENGSGKSTFLLHLNEVLEDSFYLPSQPNLAIADNELLASSGEKMRLHIDFLIQGNERFILLDEWDANLDTANRALLEKKLDELAATRVVIEVRHRERPKAV